MGTDSPLCPEMGVWVAAIPRTAIAIEATVTPLIAFLIVISSTYETRRATSDPLDDGIDDERRVALTKRQLRLVLQPDRLRSRE
jgi:hypothetical protein